MSYDLVIFNGYLASASGVLPPPFWIGVKGGKVATISTEVLQGKQVIDADGGMITPGGIDSHTHIDQDGSKAGDTFESATKSAIAGGTTTVLCFAVQPSSGVGALEAVESYQKRARGSCWCDYGFHLIVTKATDLFLNCELPQLVAEKGITSVKVYMTYPALKVDDGQLMKVLIKNRLLGVTTMVHAENSDIIDYIIERLEDKDWVDPFFHAVSRPMEAEDEATYRAITIAGLVDSAILLVHMSAPNALDHVRRARARNIPIYAETCPQYLFLTSENLKGHFCFCHEHKTESFAVAQDKFEPSKYICSPPLRESASDLQAVWKYISNGTVTTFSSDHAPSIYDHPEGKKKGLVNGKGNFKNVPNGLPGIETRIPLLYALGVETGRISVEKFVEITATNPAKLYGLSNLKGAIVPGADADIVIWYPKDKMRPFRLTNSMLHHAIDYTPFEGLMFTNWPRYTILRGQVVWDRDRSGLDVSAAPGEYLKRQTSSLPAFVSNKIKNYLE
ncbi:hypothetical protein KL925_004291 [Ogataea polymorpha]|nr:hypothetical protein KL925_004291 [Ogataea polymorpha]